MLASLISQTVLDLANICLKMIDFAFELKDGGFKMVNVRLKVVDVCFEILNISFEIIDVSFDQVRLCFQMADVRFEMVDVGFDLFRIGLHIVDVGFKKVDICAQGDNIQINALRNTVMVVELLAYMLVFAVAAVGITILGQDGRS